MQVITWSPWSNLMGNDSERFGRSGIISCVELASRVPGFMQVLLNTKTFRVQWQPCQDLKGLRTTNQYLYSEFCTYLHQNIGNLSKTNIEETGKKHETYLGSSKRPVSLETPTNATAQFQMDQQWRSNRLRCTWWREQRWGAVQSQQNSCKLA